MKAAAVALVVAIAGCAPARPVVTADEAARTLCDGPDAWPVVVEGGRVFVDAVVEAPRGPSRVRLMVDTGGNAIGVALFARSASRLGVRDPATLPRVLRVGDRTSAMPDGAAWVLVDDSPSSIVGRARPGESDGQIGAGWLSRRRLCLDPTARRLGLGEPGAFDVADDPAAIPLELAEEAPYGARYGFVLADVGGERLKLLVDTGATAGMLHDRALAPLTERLPWAEVAAGDWDMIAGAHAAERVVRAPLRLAGAPLGDAVFVSRDDGTFAAMYTPLPGGGPDGAVGNDVWLRHRVLLDSSSARLFAWPILPNSEPEARVPVSVSFDARGCPVVARASAEARSDGLAVGDRITRIDGRPACGVGHSTLSRWLARPAGAQVSITRARGGEQAVVAVASRPALPRRPRP